MAALSALSAQPDEDWQDFNEFTAASDASPEPAEGAAGEPGPERELSAGCPGVESTLSGERNRWSPTQELLHDFEQKLSLCFTNNCTHTDTVSHITPITEEHLLRQDE